MLSTPQYVLVKLVSAIFRTNLKTMVKPHTRANKTIDLLTVSMKQQPRSGNQDSAEIAKRFMPSPQKNCIPAHRSEIQHF